MSQWKRRVDELLYEGESIRESVDVGSSRVVVTSHRVLAFTPETAGENFTGTERPNVDGVSLGARTDDNLLRRALQFGVGGGLLAVVGYFVDFGSTFGDLNLNSEAAGRVGAGQLIGVAQTLIDIMALLDFLLLLSGGVLLFLTALLIGVYWFRREPTLVISIAGGGDIHLPQPTDATSARTRLEAAIFPDAGSAADTGNPGVSDPQSETDVGHDSSKAGFGDSAWGTVDDADDPTTGRRSR